MVATLGRNLGYPVPSVTDRHGSSPDDPEGTNHTHLQRERCEMPTRQRDDRMSVGQSIIFIAECPSLWPSVASLPLTPDLTIDFKV